jgi:cell division protein FtsI (penicillin-binding protein 3)
MPPSATFVSWDFVTGRGNILDRNGVILASSLPVVSVYATPSMIMNPKQVARKLVSIFPELHYSRLYQQISSEKSFVWIKRHISPSEHYKVNALGVPGLDFLRSEKRVYPFGSLASHVVGFTDIDQNGLAGFEKWADKLLRQQNQTSLTIDIRLQAILYQALEKALKKFKAIGASAIMLDCENGEILAMISLPDFDPNHPPTKDIGPLFNKNISGVYEMGSIFKLFTLALGLEHNRLDLNESFDISKPLKLGRFSIHDYRPKKPVLTGFEVFLNSSNIGTGQIALRFSAQEQRAFLEKFNLFEPLSIELPEMAFPLFPSYWGQIHQATIGYGHGIAVTPLRAIQAISSLVNGGKPITPHLYAKNQQPNPSKPLISSKTSEQIRDIMKAVVEIGSGKQASVVGYQIGGKTGTAEKPQAGRYSKTAQITSFIAAFPIDRPKYMVLVMVDEPKATADTFGFATSGWICGPIIHEIIPQIASILNFHPNHFWGEPSS